MWHKRDIPQDTVEKFIVTLICDLVTTCGLIWLLRSFGVELSIIQAAVIFFVARGLQK